jgi:nicotinamidase-related amidase
MLMKKALVLIDLQYDFLNASGRMPAAQDQIEPMLAHIHCAAAAANASGDPVIGVANRFARFDPGNLFRRFAAVAGSPGSAWDERAPESNAGTFTKAAGSAFSNPDFENALQSRGIGEIVLTGVYTSGCVAATARDGLRRGFKVSLLALGTADNSEKARQSAIRRLERAGVRIVKTL